MIGLGGVLTVFAAWRYRVVNRAIERGEIEADPRMVMAITAIILTAAVAVIVYVIISAAAFRRGRIRRANDRVTLARKTFAWHKTTLARVESQRSIDIKLCRQSRLLPTMQRLKRACFGIVLKAK